ncbi:hypothetical protein FISHEDRAFT_69504 [Fistulina hepatica ATCC 64428]|uniref:Alpha/beta hydrolase fold-3 domain-containing protein n=1 Tax=Fistulina hepatica ATCC 64428 TaxID=1128425 RepID=A0A0D7API9_9AGAR|nr:hypothetical protein FISHEDRAFT_69504 [Fistulina hepatica ATCC 64428]
MSQVAQPLHPDIVPRLDSEYKAFHESHLANIIPPHTLPWDPSIRNAPAVPGGSPLLEVGGTKDYKLSQFSVRVFTPKDSASTNGWPVFIFFHGGGWTLGNISSENSFCTNMCSRAKCAVVSVDYRLAPEHPYPAAVEDAVEALKWVHGKGESLGFNVKKIAIGGSSSGGNLAAVAALRAPSLDPPVPLVFQMLIVPVTDNTADVSGVPHVSWKENIYTPWLSPARMMWFRRNYLPNVEDWAKWDASPLFAPDELVAKTPKAWIAVAELDILRDEGIVYGDKLKKMGVEAEVKVYRGAPHPIMAMDGVLSVGQQLVTDAVEALSSAFLP